MSELDNLITMLEGDLDWFRGRSDPEDAHKHKIWRMFLTVAQECKDLRSIIEQAGLSSANTHAAKPSGGRDE